MHSILQDFRYGLRLLVKAPGFAAIAVLTLAVGIGANTAIFSVVDAVLLRPLAIAQPNRVLAVQETWRGVGQGSFSVGNLSDLREQKIFERVAAANPTSFNLAAGATPERVTGSRVSSDIFPLLGVEPLRGRAFSAVEDRPGREQVVVLSERLWRTHYGSDPALLGNTIQIDGLPYTVLGVMPSSFDPLLQNDELWVPIAFTPKQLIDHDNHYLNVLARLKPESSRAQVQAALDVLAARQRKLYPIDDEARGFEAEPLAEVLFGDQRTALLTILAAVGFVLLIACANIANLQLARARARRKEIAVRVALGATPYRIMRQLLAESVLLGAVAGAGGMLLAAWGVPWLVSLAPPGVPRIGEARMDGWALAFAACVALTSSVVFGLAPALRAASVRLSEAFKEGAGTASAHRDRLRSVLVAAEIALALVLLTGAGLLVRSALLVSRMDPGFDTSNLMVGRIGLPETGYSDAKTAEQTFEHIRESAAQLPGVSAAALVSRAPLAGGGGSNGLIAEGKALDPQNIVDARLQVVSPGYIQAARVPLKAGREFTPADTRRSTLVTLVNETLARTLWPGQDPIGKRFACCESGPKGRLDPVWHEVVGVVGDVRAWGLDQQVQPEFYVPMAQMPPDMWGWISRTMDLVIRTPSPGAVGASEVRRVVAGNAPGVPVYAMSSMREKISSTLQQSHFDTFLLTIFAATALALASVGVYGVLSYTVSQRTRDIGIRMALGASRGHVVRDVLGHGLRLTAIGVAVGLAGALAAARLLKSMLFGVKPTDAATFAVVALLLTVVAMIAAYLPARRASRVDPMVALRHE